MRTIVNQTLDPAQQNRQVLQSRTVMTALPQEVPANLIHEEDVANLTVATKRIRQRTLADIVAGWLPALATSVLGIGLAIAIPAVGPMIAAATAVALIAEGMAALLGGKPANGISHPLPVDLAELHTTYTQAVGNQKIQAAAAAAALSGVDLNGHTEGDFDRIQRDFVFSNVPQSVSYRYMVVSPLETLPFVGSRAVTTESIATAPDPAAPPRGAQTVATVPTAGLQRLNFAHYVDPSQDVTAVETGPLNGPPNPCADLPSTLANPIVDLTFDPVGQPAWLLTSQTSNILTATLSTSVYATPSITTTQSLVEPEPRSPVPYDLENHWTIPSDVLVVESRT
ncbi:MAG: hypothetical protein KGR26_15575, partial [Cyanobacteria bacterium REEB65]|nr:hypothetical protein [Cyanobacteria bacterium REEB65]